MPFALGRLATIMAGVSQPPSRVDPDAPLVQRARAGDYQAFEQLVSRYERPLYALAMGIVRQHQDAEEVLQETFLSVLEHLDGFEGNSTFHTWLVRIATNHALKVLRKRRGSRLVAIQPNEQDNAPLPHPSFIAHWKDEPGELAQRREVRQLLDEALGELDEKYRLVFLLRDVEGLSTEQAADALGISVSNAKVRLLRARLMLRERLTAVLGDAARRLVPDHRHE